ncbi:uncharacterized protein METZ01_LOCUS473289, partial [marine metagenome]
VKNIPETLKKTGLGGGNAHQMRWVIACSDADICAFNFAKYLSL